MNLYERAWNKLYEILGELGELSALEVMDNVLAGIKAEILDDIKREKGDSNNE